MDDDITTALDNKFLVPFDGSFNLSKRDTHPGDKTDGKKANVAALAELVTRLATQQQLLYAYDKRSVLLVFQAMDAAGKDGTISAVLSGVNPQGCQVFAFKVPSVEELDHDFLWRQQRAMPERGRIGVWNRSHYEEVLAVRVNPQFLAGQRLPSVPANLDDLWPQRFASIVDAEKHWARSGTTVIKFFLNVSRDEQKARLLERIDEPASNWKFAISDLETRRQWPQYMAAYQEALAATSRPWAPWYVIPADSKSYMRRMVAEIVIETLERQKLSFPMLSDKQRTDLVAAKAQLDAE